MRRVKCALGNDVQLVAVRGSECLDADECPFDEIEEQAVGSFEFPKEKSNALPHNDQIDQARQVRIWLVRV